MKISLSVAFIADSIAIDSLPVKLRSSNLFIILAKKSFAEKKFNFNLIEKKKNLLVYQLRLHFPLN
jgi:hypothetical protein